MWVLLIVMAILLLLVYRHFGLAALGTAEGVQRDGLQIGEVALPLTGVTAHGESIELVLQPGSLYLLVFVSPTCTPCTEILPSIHQLAMINGEVKVILIVDGSRERVVQLVDKFDPPVSVTCLAEGETDTYQGYHVRVTPFAFMVGKDGRIQAKGLCNSTTRLRHLLSSVGLEIPDELLQPVAPSTSRST
jgi:thiol-disulfide isomerase/thioredoxin